MDNQSSISITSATEGTITVSLGYNKDDGFYYKGDISLILNHQAGADLECRMDELVTQFHQTGKRLLLEHPQHVR